MKTIKELKKGDYFAFKVNDGVPSRVYVRGDYCRQDKTYSYFPFDDVNDEHFARPSRKVISSDEFDF